PLPPPFPYPTLFRSLPLRALRALAGGVVPRLAVTRPQWLPPRRSRRARPGHDERLPALPAPDLRRGHDLGPRLRRAPRDPRPRVRARLLGLRGAVPLSPARGRRLARPRPQVRRPLLEARVAPLVAPLQLLLRRLRPARLL